MNKLFIVCLLIAFSFAVSADWQALDNSAREGADLQVKLLSSTDKEIQVEITVPGFETKEAKAGEITCTVVGIPGASMHMVAGYPMLPKITQLISLHADCKVTMEVLSKEEANVDLKHPILPSKGHLTRDIDPDSVEFEFGPIYKEDVFWPSEEEQFQIGKNFQFRDACGLRLQVLPIRANHVQMTMTVIKKAVLVFKLEHSSYAVKTESQPAPNKTFSKMYSGMFLNYQEPVNTYDERGTVPDPNNRKLVVVTPSQYESTIANWVNWKKQSGYQVTVHSIASGTNADTIKSYLQGLYDNTATRFGYVVLIGDAAYTSDFKVAQPMPTFKGSKESAAADRVYVRLAGNDNYPDAFISRISGNNESEITNQLNKIVEYEQTPKAGKWFNQGMCIASNQGSPSDKERAEWIQNGGGKSEKVPVVDGGLAQYGYSKFTDVYDPYGYAEDVAAATNEGCSVICYIGHGSATSWVSSGFSVSDVKNLTNAGFYPVIWSVACVNGQFVHTVECFGEAWLRKANGGAVAMECASTNESWVPPCDKQAATVNSIINKQYSTFGALEAVGCIKALEVWGDTNSSEGNKLAEQCNLFGDCSMLVRTKTPQALSVNMSRGLDNNLVFEVITEERLPANATVTVYTEDFFFSVSGDTNENGTVSLSLDNCPKSPIFYTVVGAELIPEMHVPVQ